MTGKRLTEQEVARLRALVGFTERLSPVEEARLTREENRHLNQDRRFAAETLRRPLRRPRG